MVLSAINNVRNGMLLAYGQSKSGKSFTLLGEKSNLQFGLLQLSVNKFFEMQGNQSQIKDKNQPMS